MNELKSSIYNTLKSAYNDVSNFCVNENITRWKNNKKDLLDVLSMKDGWDENRLCIHKKINYVVRGADVSPAKYLLNSICGGNSICGEGCRDFIRKLIKGETLEDKKNIACTFLYYYLRGERYKGDGIFLNDAIDDWKNHPFSFLADKYWSDSDFIVSWLGDFFKVKKGQSIKMTRALQKVVDLYTKEGMTINNQELTDAQDCLISKEYTTALCISVHPCDYLTQSHGRGWSSCHSLRDLGCYHAGILNMMVDNTSVIVYTLKLEDYYNALEKNLPFHDIEKVKRASVFKNDDVIMVSPLYPDCQNNVKNNPLFDAIKKEVFDIFDCKEWSEIDKYDTHIDSTQYFGYADWNSKSVTVKSCVDSPKLIIGRDAIAVDGEDESDIIDDSETMELNRNKTFCKCCGGRFNDDDMYYIENYGWVCEDCYRDGYFYYCEGSQAYYYEDRNESIIVDNCTYNRDWALNNLYICTDYYSDKLFDADKNNYYSIIDDEEREYYFIDEQDYLEFIYEVVRNDIGSFSNFLENYEIEFNKEDE